MVSRPTIDIPDRLTMKLASIYETSLSVKNALEISKRHQILPAKSLQKIGLVTLQGDITTLLAVKPYRSRILIDRNTKFRGGTIMAYGKPVVLEELTPLDPPACWTEDDMLGRRPWRAGLVRILQV